MFKKFAQKLQSLADAQGAIDPTRFDDPVANAIGFFCHLWLRLK